jgi:autophagy-related protein 18
MGNGNLGDELVMTPLMTVTNDNSNSNTRETATNRSTTTMLRFNQSSTALAIVARSGALALYNTDPFGGVYSSRNSSASVAELLFSTSLVAVVGPPGADTELRVINTRKDVCICTLQYAERILNVHMNRQRLIAVFATHILIYNVATMKLLHRIGLDGSPTEGGSNVMLVSALSSSSSSSSSQCMLAYQQCAYVSTDDFEDSDTPLDAEETRNMIVFDTISMQRVSLIPCHQNSISGAILSQNGVLLATCSIKGTIIRVFNTRTSKKVAEFRRGTLPARITSMTFSPDNTVLACCSGTGTVHFFNVPEYIAELGVSVMTPTTTVKNSSLSSSSTPSETTDTSSPTSTHELPLLSTITDNERDEVQSLINSVESLPKASSKGTKKERKKSSNSSSSALLWNRYKHYIPIPASISSLIAPQRDFASITFPGWPYAAMAVALSSNRQCYVAMVGQSGNGDATNRNAEVTTGEFVQCAIPSAVRTQSTETGSDRVPVQIVHRAPFAV